MKSTLAAVVVLSTSVLAASGCQATKDFASSHGLTTMPSSQAVSLIQSYLGNMGDLTSLLNGATTTASAQTAAPAATSKLDTLKSLAAKLQSLPTSDKANLASTYGGKLTSALESLKSAASGASSNPATASSFSDVLKNLDYKQLFPL